MSRSLVLLLALSPALLAAPDVPPVPKVKMGLRVVATIYYSSGRRGGTGIVRPAPHLAVKIFPEKGDKPIKEVKTDDKGMLVVPLPAGKYRVEAVVFENMPTRRDKKSVEEAVKEGAVSEVKLKFLYAGR